MYGDVYCKICGRWFPDEYELINHLPCERNEMNKKEKRRQHLFALLSRADAYCNSMPTRDEQARKLEKETK